MKREKLNRKQILQLGWRIMQMAQAEEPTINMLHHIIRDLGFLNGSVHKSFQEADPEDPEMEGFVYVIKEVAIASVINNYRRLGIPIYTSYDKNIVYLYIDNVQTSFHLNRGWKYENNSPVDYNFLDSTPEIGWNKLIRGYRYTSDIYDKYISKVNSLGENDSLESIYDLGDDIPEDIYDEMDYCPFIFDEEYEDYELHILNMDTWSFDVNDMY